MKLGWQILLPLIPAIVTAMACLLLDAYDAWENKAVITVAVLLALLFGWGHWLSRFRRKR